MNEQKQVSNQQTQPVQTQEPVKKKKVKIKGFFRWLARHPKLLILFILVVAIAVGGPFFWLAIRDRISIYSATSKLGFEDIGEMATQSAYCKETSMQEADRNILGVHIPFTQSKYIYSYDVTIKAGYDFGEIEWSVDEEKKIIQVKLPEAKVLSNEIDLDSLKIYHEEESIFRPITLEENNTAMKNLQETAEKDAIANGLLENAESNAKTILKAFFAQAFDLEEYEVQFS